MTTLAPMMTTMSPVLGYSNDPTQAEYTAQNNPLLVTLAPILATKKKSMSALEILLIAIAVAVGVITLCVLLSVSKK
jgi:hypothetical protein